jgi:hypothetical protein
MNKKIIVLIVLAECILAILLVSFFGKVIEETRRDVVCQDIYFIDENGLKIEDGVPIIVDIDSDALKPIRYKLKWKIITSKTTEKTVVIETSDKSVSYDYGRGELVISPYCKKSVVITVRTTDGSEKYDTITLIPNVDTNSDVEI